MPEPTPCDHPATAHEVSVQGSGAVFHVAPGQTVLQAALLGGVKLPSSCRNGTGRACRCRCVSGQAVHTVEWPGLSADEKLDRWILPCVAQPLSDLVLAFEQGLPGTGG